jgi:hypothetical protein
MCERARERERERECVYPCCVCIYVYKHAHIHVWCAYVYKHAHIHVCIHTQDETAYNQVGTRFRAALNTGMGGGSKQIAERDVDYQVLTPHI